MRNTKSYSNDIRSRVIDFLKLGNTYQEASRIFKVSKSAIGSWNKRYKEEGESKARKRGGSKRRIDLEELKNYVISNPNMHLKEASSKFGVSVYSISYWLKELGFSYKKNLYLCGSK